MSGWVGRKRKPGPRTRSGRLKRRPAADDMFGGRTAAVYIMGANGLTKIGYSANPWARVRQMQVGFGDLVELRWALRMSREDAQRVERLAHKLFDSMKARVRGEWFWVDSAVAAEAVKRIVEQLGIVAIVETEREAA